MGEFFRGWRRKAGLVTLAMACLLTVAWMRSCVTLDEFLLESLDGWIVSSDQTIQFESSVSDASGMVGIGTIWSVPYWSLVLPLTLLSAWLILIKPWPAKSAKESNRA